ncbi:hypothetical protein ACQKM1_02260 [Peribacillus frigoritolerans]|uniref:hypothetical protein n=1 Tax=Peribacillus frigoritolerans TaxID=450367 RepID=UPI003CFE34C0
MGSGSTGQAAINLKGNFIGFELDNKLRITSFLFFLFDFFCATGSCTFAGNCKIQLG